MQHEEAVSQRRQKWTEFELWRRLRTFRAAVEVVAPTQPTEGSNLATTSHAGGRTPVVGLLT